MRHKNQQQEGSEVKMRNLGLGLLAAALLALAGGCVRNKIVIRVKPDGSGDILVTRILSRETVRMAEMQIEQMRAHMGTMGGEIPEDPFYNEESLKQEAVWFGPEVEYVGSRKIQQDGARGSLTHYRFADIRKVTLRPESFGMETAQRSMIMMGGMMQEPPPAISPERAFTFEFEPGESARVTVRPPVYPKPLTMDAGRSGMNMAQMQQGMSSWLQQMGTTESPFGLTGQESPSEAMAKLLKDTELEVQIDIVGELIETDARYPEADRPTRFTLLRVRPEVIAQDEDPERFFEAMDEDSLPFLGLMVGMPESRIETNRTVSIRFQ